MIINFLTNLFTKISSQAIHIISLSASVKSVASALSNPKMAALLHGLPTHEIMVMSLIFLYSTNIQPICWEPNKEREESDHAFILVAA